MEEQWKRIERLRDKHDQELSDDVDNIWNNNGLPYPEDLSNEAKATIFAAILQAHTMRQLSVDLGCMLEDIRQSIDEGNQ